MTARTVKYTGRTLLSWEDDAIEFTVEEEFTVFWGNYIVRVNKGFKTDLASIPRLFQSIIPKLGHHIRPAIVHDYCYVYDTGLTKKEADDLFLDGMQTLKVNFARRWVMWAAVRVGGKGYWDK